MLPSIQARPGQREHDAMWAHVEHTGQVAGADRALLGKLRRIAPDIDKALVADIAAGQRETARKDRRRRRARCSRSCGRRCTGRCRGHRR